jgi:NAD(P)-dependent dehydrogenase (short-subunit alcohol dehydrogenase family)
LSVEGLLKDKVVIVTGAGSGVGHAAALLFARHGAKVLAADVNGEAVGNTVAAVKAAGGIAIAQTCDVSVASAVDGIVAAAVHAFGRLDVMYNNVGITLQPKPGQPLRTFANTTQEEIDRLYAVNVGGVMNGCRAAVRQFELQGGGGAIVNTASVAGLIGYGGTVYGSTKGAVTTLTRTLAIELAPQGIRVNSVCPAGMPTNFIGGGVSMSEAARASMSAAHPLGRPIEPLECANAALFLASDLASNITGVNLPVDGGLTAGVPLKRR